MEQPSQDPNVGAKSEWNSPRYRRIEAKDAELGFGVGADLIILDTSS